MLLLLWEIVYMCEENISLGVGDFHVTPLSPHTHTHTQKKNHTHTQRKPRTLNVFFTHCSLTLGLRQVSHLPVITHESGGLRREVSHVSFVHSQTRPTPEAAPPPPPPPPPPPGNRHFATTPNGPISEGFLLSSHWLHVPSGPMTWWCTSYVMEFLSYDW